MLKQITATIVSCETGNQYELIRQALESLNVLVIHHPIGRPKDFIDFLSGANYIPSDFIIFVFHGQDGEFAMPELSEDIYFNDEPRGNFGAEEITRFCSIEAPVIINMGCSMGTTNLSKAFLNNACQVYIGANDYPDATSAGFFVIRLFYEKIQNKHSLYDAFRLACETDSETRFYQWFEKGEQV